MRVARIARPGAIYDASAASERVAEWKMTDREVRKKSFSEIIEIGQEGIRSDFERALFPLFLKGTQSSANKVTLIGENKKVVQWKTNFTVAHLVF